MTILQPMSVSAVINLVDAISFMVAAPSLIFYVLQVGGDKDIYGWIMSSFSFASFVGQPLVGIWVDKTGNKFRRPYLATSALSVIGGLLYFFANGFQLSPKIAVGIIFLGRVLGGLGAARGALVYAYTASVVPLEQQTKVNSLLSTTRTLGMASGPFFNIFLSKVNSTMTIGNFTIPLDPLSSVGLMVAFMNALAALYIFFALPEPPKKEKNFNVVEPVHDKTDKSDVWKSVWCIEIMLPLFIAVVVNSSFLLIDVALPPAAADGLGWGPVQTSAVLGSTSFLIIFCLFATVYLSDKMSDIMMVAFGHSLLIVGGSGIFLFWIRGASAAHFVAPVMVTILGAPFIMASNRSNYTAAVVSKPSLESVQSLMQSVLAMAQSIAGFIAPGLVASFIVRSPEQVTESRDQRELTPWALYVPIVSIPILFGLYMLHRKTEKALTAKAEGATLTDEGTTLIRKGKEGRYSSTLEIEQAFSRKTEVARRVSCEVMGYSVFDTKREREYRKKLQHDLEEMAQIEEVVFE